MATQSIMKNIVISEPKAAEIFVDALEKAAKAAKHSRFHEVDSQDLTKDDLKNYFGVMKKNDKN